MASSEETRKAVVSRVECRTTGQHYHARTETITQPDGAEAVSLSLTNTELSWSSTPAGWSQANSRRADFQEKFCLAMREPDHSDLRKITVTPDSKEKLKVVASWQLGEQVVNFPLVLEKSLPAAQSYAQLADDLLADNLALKNLVQTAQAAQSRQRAQEQALHQVIKSLEKAQLQRQQHVQAHAALLNRGRMPDDEASAAEPVQVHGGIGDADSAGSDSNPEPDKPAKKDDDQEEDGDGEDSQASREDFDLDSPAGSG